MQKFGTAIFQDPLTASGAKWPYPSAICQFHDGRFLLLRGETLLHSVAFTDSDLWIQHE